MLSIWSSVKPFVTFLQNCSFLFLFLFQSFFSMSARLGHYWIYVWEPIESDVLQSGQFSLWISTILKLIPLCFIFDWLVVIYWAYCDLRFAANIFKLPVSGNWHRHFPYGTIVRPANVTQTTRFRVNSIQSIWIQMLKWCICQLCHKNANLFALILKMTVLNSCSIIEMKINWKNRFNCFDCAFKIRLISKTTSIMWEWIIGPLQTNFIYHIVSFHRSECHSAVTNHPIVCVTCGVFIHLEIILRNFYRINRFIVIPTYFDLCNLINKQFDFHWMCFFSLSFFGFFFFRFS